MLKAKQLIENCRGKTLSWEERCAKAIELAALMLEEANRTQTHSEKSHYNQLANMLSDPNGKIFIAAMTDQCFRSQNPQRVADQLAYLLDKYGIPSFFGQAQKLGFWFFKHFGKALAPVTVPLVKHLIRKEASTVILPGEADLLTKHMRKRMGQGVRVNLNHLGEAILGEDEALHRLEVYLEDLEKPEVDYISVKISTICSQLNLLAWEDTLSILIPRLKMLYRSAQENGGVKGSKFVNLDMEEYRDLLLTVDVFQRVLEDPEFLHYSAGIVLQSYIPDSFLVQKKLTEWAMQRVAMGGAPIKIRIVKGANLAMEKVEAALKGWPQAPYLTKHEVDANYKKMVAYGCLPVHAKAVHLGIASHNLFDIACALLMRAENQVEEDVTFEMLEGMADHLRRVVQELAGGILLYCPAATYAEFQNAIAYLIRRLDENTAPENFLRHVFEMVPGSKYWQEQSDFFAMSCQAASTVAEASRRTQSRWSRTSYPQDVSAPFSNEPDTDWTLPQNRGWAEAILSKWSKFPLQTIPLVLGQEKISADLAAGITQEAGEDPSYSGKALYYYTLANPEHIEKAIQIARTAHEKWSQESVHKRVELLGCIAQGLRDKRADLIGAMVADTGKIITEADGEVSEAIDFAEYYRRDMLEISTLMDIRWDAKGAVLVAPPWNFPCSIPAGGILAALATGNSVIFKPAAEAVLVGWVLAQVFWEAGVSPEVLQFVTCQDEPVGSLLVQNPGIASIVLTGATSTAKLFLELCPGKDLIAETGGKNAMILTNLCDRDLAIRDLIQSAFGHSGQKCSACSLAICEAEVYDAPHFRKQLLDAAASLRVGSPWDPATRINPLIRPPASALLRSLTTLEEGEEWLLQPKPDPQNSRLWSPGIKLGVKPNSFTHQTELFGPVLGVMRADNLEHAVTLANATPYGLTAGLHSLDERELEYWVSKIEAGNCYINRGMTGAIVQRQPFGGCKQSSFGRGLKAGGPNYLMQFVHPQQKALPQHGDSFSGPVEALSRLVEKESLSADQKELWKASFSSYAFYWNRYFSQSHDPGSVLGEDNIQLYVPHSALALRVQPQDAWLDVMRVIAAALTCGVSMEVSCDPGFEPYCRLLKPIKNLSLTEEREQEFIQRIVQGRIDRLRLLSRPSKLVQQALGEAACNVINEPVLANGRVELLHCLREMSISYDYHRYGNLGDREKFGAATPP